MSFCCVLISADWVMFFGQVSLMDCVRSTTRLVEGGDAPADAEVQSFDFGDSLVTDKELSTFTKCG